MWPSLIPAKLSINMYEEGIISHITAQDTSARPSAYCALPELSMDWTAKVISLSASHTRFLISRRDSCSWVKETKVHSIKVISLIFQYIQLLLRWHIKHWHENAQLFFRERRVFQQQKRTSTNQHKCIFALYHKNFKMLVIWMLSVTFTFTPTVFRAARQMLFKMCGLIAVSVLLFSPRKSIFCPRMNEKKTLMWKFQLKLRQICGLFVLYCTRRPCGTASKWPLYPPPLHRLVTMATYLHAHRYSWHSWHPLINHTLCNLVNWLHKLF